MGRKLYPILVLVFAHATMCSPGVFFGDDDHVGSSSTGVTKPQDYQQHSPSPDSGQYTSHSEHREDNNQFKTETSSSSYSDSEHPTENNNHMTESSSSSYHKEWSDHNPDGENQYGLESTAHTTSSNDGYGSQSQPSTAKSVGDEARSASPKDAGNGEGLDGAASEMESYESSQSKEPAEMAKIKPEKALGGVLEFDGDNSDIDDFDFGLDELFAEDDIDVQTKEILPNEWVIILDNYLEALGKQKPTKKIKYKIRKANELKELQDGLVTLGIKDYENEDPKKLQCAKMEYDVLSHIHHLSIEDQKYIFDIDKDGIPDFEVVEVEEPMKRKHKKRRHKKKQQNTNQQQDQNGGGTQSPTTDVHGESHDQNDDRQRNSYSQQTESDNEFHNQNPTDNSYQQHDTQQYGDESEHEVHQLNENGHHDEPVYNVQVRPYTYTGEQQSRPEPEDGYRQQKQQEEQYKR